VSLPDAPSGWSQIHSDTFGAADLLFLLEAPGGDAAVTLDDPKDRVRAWAGGEIAMWDRDGDTAVANSLAAVRAGAVHVQGTANGLGERCGNANLFTVLADLQLKRGYDLVPLDRLEQPVELGRREGIPVSFVSRQGAKRLPRTRVPDDSRLVDARRHDPLSVETKARPIGV
jgi:hypothetical protein